MFFIIILLLSAGMIVLMRAIITLISKTLVRIILKSESATGYESKWSVILSGALLLAYISIFATAVSIPSFNNNLTNAEWYTVFVSIGVFSISWCYFSWPIEELFAKPAFEEEKRMYIKKIFVFSLLFIFTVNSGYREVMKNVINSSNGSDDEISKGIYILSNVAVVASIIALDRVLNQIYSYYKKVKEEKKQSELQGVN